MPAVSQPRSDTAAESTAAWSTMRADRRFLWFWLGVATTLSVGGNVGHAWLTVVSGATRGMAIGWAIAPPALLMLAIHGLPTLARMLGSSERDAMLTVVVWGVTVGAFGWSAFGIFGFTTALGVPDQMAWLAPLVIDLSVFGATRGLVLTAPLAIRLKTTIVSRGSELISPASPSASPVATSIPGTPTAWPPSSSSAPSTPTAEPAPALHTSAAAVAGPAFASAVSGTRELAEQIVAAGAVRKPVETVAAILSAAESESRKAVIAEHTGVHHSVVTKILEAAESHRLNDLAIVR